MAAAANNREDEDESGNRTSNFPLYLGSCVVGALGPGPCRAKLAAGGKAAEK